ncbi:MAG: pyridoxamine 5'-phosphate oxidase family protein [Acidimicrobiales bacterium]
MARTYDAIDGRLADFVLGQSVFFVATAPSGDGGHVNCSPKGNDGTLALLGPRTLAYLDGTGSGVETIAHLRDNGRIVLMWCAFAGPPRVVRVHGQGEAVVDGDPRFVALCDRFAGGVPLGTRAVVVVEAERISDACGYGVPLMDFVAHRDAMDTWARQKGPDGLAEYQSQRNATSLDGLPGLPDRPDRVRGAS